MSFIKRFAPLAAVLAFAPVLSIAQDKVRLAGKHSLDDH